MTSIETQVLQPYKYGFTTDIEADIVAAGSDGGHDPLISAKKDEPEWMLDWRLKAYRHWLTMTEPTLGQRHVPADRLPGDQLLLGAQAAAASSRAWTQVDPKLLETFEKLGIPLSEQKRLAGVAVDAVFDSVSVATTFRAELAKYGVIFCPFSEAVREHPELVEKYLGTVVPTNDNFFAALNSAVFTDGSFGYIPKGVRCPLELSTYFRINAAVDGAVRAHADRRRRRQPRLLPRGLLRPDARREPAARRGGRAGGARQRHDQVLDDSELVSGRRRRARRDLQLRDQARQLRAARTPRFPGPRSRPARPSPGSTRAAFCRATTRSASSTRWR